MDILLWPLSTCRVKLGVKLIFEWMDSFPVTLCRESLRRFIIRFQQPESSEVISTAGLETKKKIHKELFSAWKVLPLKTALFFSHICNFHVRCDQNISSRLTFYSLEILFWVEKTKSRWISPQAKTSFNVHACLSHTICIQMLHQHVLNPYNLICISRDSSSKHCFVCYYCMLLLLAQSCTVVVCVCCINH